MKIITDYCNQIDFKIDYSNMNSYPIEMLNLITRLHKDSINYLRSKLNEDLEMENFIS